MSKKFRTLLICVVIVAFVSAIALPWFFLQKSHKKMEGIIKVGILHSLTGVLAVTEKSVVDAALFAIDEINESGGVLGKKIVPIVADGKSDWPTFAKEAERLIAQEQVSVIFGGVTSASRKMMKAVVEKHDHLLFYPAQHEGLETSPNIIYLGSTANQQAIPAVAWCLQNLGNRLFLVGSDYIYPRAVNSIIKDYVAARDGLVVGEEYILFDQINIDNVIKKIIETKPNVIINTVVGDKNSQLFKALRNAGISNEKLPTMSLTVTETELAEFKIDEMIGNYGTQNYFQSLDTPANNKFVEKFQKKYGAQRAISSHMENAYSALYWWRNAVNKAQTTVSTAVREQLHGAALSTPEGIISISRSSLYSWKPVLIGKIFPNRQFGIVWNSVSTIEPLPYPPLQTKEHWENLLKQLFSHYGNKWW